MYKTELHDDVMTSVRVLCLNHKRAFGVFGTGDSDGEERLDVCKAAGHRVLFFHGRYDRAHHFAWLYPKQDFNEIESSVSEQYKYRTNPGGKPELFLKTWKLLVDEGFNPEWFLPTPGLRIHSILDFNDFKRKESNTISLDTIRDFLTISENPYSNDNYKEQREYAISRHRACIESMNINRTEESEFAKFLNELSSSPILEQRWLSLMSMRYYLFNRLSDFSNFDEWIIQNLIASEYLIRDEARDMLQILILKEPEIALNFTANLIESRIFNQVMTGMDLLCRLWSDHYYQGRDAASLSRMHRSVVAENMVTYEELLEKSMIKMKDLLESFFDRNAYWKPSERSDNIIEVLEQEPLSSIQDDIEYSLVILRRGMSLLRFPRKHFDE